MSDPLAAINQMRSVTATQGMVSACVWDYSVGMSFLRHFWDAATSEDESAHDVDEGTRFPLCRRSALIDLFNRAGLKDVMCEPISIVTNFNSFDDYWQPFLGGTGPAPAYVASLDQAGRERLIENLKQRLQPNAHGQISLKARAWAIKGRSVQGTAA